MTYRASDDVLWEQGAGGSNPLTPTILRLLIELLLSGFCAGTAFAARPGRGRRSNPLTSVPKQAVMLRSGDAVHSRTREQAREHL